MSFSRHESYGSDTPIAREGMVRTFLLAQRLKKMLPACETVYCSPIARAKQTAEFQALGLECSHLLESEALIENVPTFVARKFINQVILNTSPEVKYYHFVTHLPVLEKLGLPVWSAGAVCVLSASSWTDMLAENFEVQTFEALSLDADFYRNFAQNAEEFEKMTAEQIYIGCMQEMKKTSEHSGADV